MPMNPAKQYRNISDTMGPKRKAYLENKWKRNIGAVKKVFPTISRDRTLTLATVLENTEREINKAVRRMNESGTQVPDIGPFKFHVYDLITAMYPNSIAEELVSVQPLSQRVGQIFFLRYLYGKDKGSIKAGTDMLNPWTGAAPYNRYDSEQIDDESIGESGKTDYEGFLQYIPVRPGTVAITAGNVTLTDDGKGNLKESGGTNRGTINYQTGAYDITLGAAASEDVGVSYLYNQEYGPARTGEVTVKVDESIITARPHKLSALWAFDAAYDLEASQGIRIEDAILEACTAEIRHERDGNVINALFNQAGNTSTWNINIPGGGVGVTQKQHYETFITELFRACTRIMTDTKKVQGNWVVVGKTGIDTLYAVGAPRFVGTGDFAPNGPHFAGTIDNRLKVYFDPFLNEDDYLVGYKGNLYLDAGYIIGDYLPIFASQLIMLEDFVGRRGFCSMYGTKMVNNRMYVKGQILHTPNNTITVDTTP